MTSALQYSPEYFRTLWEILDRDPWRHYEGCRRVDGQRIYSKKTNKPTRTAIRVRFALRDPAKPATCADNIGLFCTSCRRGEKSQRRTKNKDPRQMEMFAGVRR